MRDWFHVEALAEGVWQLTEPGHVCSWLVAGSRRAALIDTGCGIAPIRPVVESLTHLPVTVVNTHNHFDHVGGNAEFAEIAIHAAGAAGLEQVPAAALLDAYATYAQSMVAAYVTWAALDARYFHLRRAGHEIRPLPPHVHGRRWRISPSRATELLADGDRVDLGNRTLRVIHTPGHSPDAICLELEDERILFGGDTVNTGPVYAQLPGSDPATLAASLDRLAEEGQSWDRIFCSHFLRTEVGPEYLAEQVAAFDALLRGDAPLTPALDCVGGQVLEARFDGFSILVAAEWSPHPVAHVITSSGGMS